VTTDGSTERWTILVGFDGSDHAGDALAFGERLAAATGGRLVLGCVYRYRAIRGRLGSGDRAAATVAAGRGRASMPCGTAITLGLSIAEGLIQLARAQRADVVVLGTRHRGRLGEALPGATARQVLRDGRHAVAVVPHAHRPRKLARIGVRADPSPDGARAALTGARLARDAGASLCVYRGRADASVPAVVAAVHETVTAVEVRRDLSDDLAQGHLDLLVIPAWSHGLMGRLRRRGRRGGARGAPCPVVIVPSRAGVVRASRAGPAVVATTR
jgi:nucleotide-binding universal stress UspA family protein